MRLTAIIRIDPKNRKGEKRSRSLNGSQHGFLTPVQEGQAFRPASRYVSKSQRVQVASLDDSSAMCNEIRFQKTGSAVIPILECADRNLLLEQGSRSRGGETTQP